MIQEQAAATVCIALISEKTSQGKREKKGRICVKPWLKRKKKNLEFYETLLVELWLADKYNYKHSI